MRSVLDLKALNKEQHIIKVLILGVLASLITVASPIKTQATLQEAKPPTKPITISQTVETKKDTAVQTVAPAPEPEPIIVFDANDRSTWPVCTETQWVWAQDGTCHEKPVSSPVVAQATVSNVSFGGDCDSWLAAAGIEDVASAKDLIRRESGCNPNVVNAGSGSCGVAQELPCGKSGCSLGDGACQVRWMNSYVLGRYGSWGAALAHSYANNWY